MIGFIEKLNKLYERYIYKNTKLEKLAFGAILVGIFAIMYVLNKHTPWVADDFAKSTGVLKRQNISDWIRDLKWFYLKWGGRIWGEFFTNLFLVIPKATFNIINTIGYIVTLLLIYLNILGEFKVKPFLLLFINFALFACLPCFGQDIFWISGSGNYMWSALIPLLVLAFWRMRSVNDGALFSNPVFIIIVSLLSVLAGWMNENFSVSIIFMMGCYLYLYKQQQGTRKVYFAIASLAATAIGSVMLWAAPGNFVRFASEGRSKSIISIAGKVFSNSFSLFGYDTGLILLVIITVLVFISYPKLNKNAMIYLAGAFVGAAAMAPVGGIHGRTIYSTIVLLIIAAGIMLDDTEKIAMMPKIKVVLALFMVISIYNFRSEAKAGIYDYEKRFNDNIQIILSEKQKGNLNITVNPITPKNRFCAAYRLGDVQPKEKNKHWLNRGMARYFKIKTIQSVKVE